MAKAPKAKTTKFKSPRQYHVGVLPARGDILKAMTEHPELDGKRDLYKYFGIHGDMKTPFKLLLKEMEGEGFLARSRKQIRRTATLPQVTALDIPADADPDNLHAFPATWDETEGDRPRVLEGSSRVGFRSHLHARPRRDHHRVHTPDITLRIRNRQQVDAE